MCYPRYSMYIIYNILSSRSRVRARKYKYSVRYRESTYTPVIQDTSISARA